MKTIIKIIDKIYEWKTMILTIIITTLATASVGLSTLLISWLIYDFIFNIINI